MTHKPEMQELPRRKRPLGGMTRELVCAEPTGLGLGGPWMCPSHKHGLTSFLPLGLAKQVGGPVEGCPSLWECQLQQIPLAGWELLGASRQMTSPLSQSCPFAESDPPKGQNGFPFGFAESPLQKKTGHSGHPQKTHLTFWFP